MKKIIIILMTLTTFVLNIQLAYPASQEEEAAEIRRVWTSFVSNLSNQDIDAAIEYVTEEQKEGLREAFYFIIDKLPEAFAKREEFKIKEIDENVAQGENIAYEKGGIYSYPVTFIKNDKGEWKIRSF